MSSVDVIVSNSSMVMVNNQATQHHLTNILTIRNCILIVNKILSGTTQGMFIIKWVLFSNITTMKQYVHEILIQNNPEPT